MQFGINIIRQEYDRFMIQVLPSSIDGGIASVYCSAQELEELGDIIVKALECRPEYSVEFE